MDNLIKVTSALLIIVLLTNVIFYLAVIEPKKQKIMRLEQKITELNALIEADKDLIGNLGEYKEHFVKIEQYFEKLKNSPVPEEIEK